MARRSRLDGIAYVASSRTDASGRGPAADGTPYTVWRAREIAFAHLIRTERMISARPGPAKRPSREWQWGGGRVSYRGPGDSVLTRNVGPHDNFSGIYSW